MNEAVCNAKRVLMAWNGTKGPQMVGPVAVDTQERERINMEGCRPSEDERITYTKEATANGPIRGLRAPGVLLILPHQFIIIKLSTTASLTLTP